LHNALNEVNTGFNLKCTRKMQSQPYSMNTPSRSLSEGEAVKGRTISAQRAHHMGQRAKEFAQFEKGCNKNYK